MHLLICDVLLPIDGLDGDLDPRRLIQRTPCWGMLSWSRFLLGGADGILSEPREVRYCVIS